MRSASSDAMESTLVDSSGMSFVPGRGLLMSIAGVVVNCGCDSQQKVSRFHIRQLRFSNRRPSSMESAHLEKTAMEVLKVSPSEGNAAQRKIYSPVHMLNRFSTFLVSMLCIFPASTVTTCAAILDGIAAGNPTHEC